MSSSGKGQSVLRGQADLESAWDYAQVHIFSRSRMDVIFGEILFQLLNLTSP
jgi:formate-dependent phosphoribosylglycinamide formyltransferase (GAR transformylase)